MEALRSEYTEVWTSGTAVPLMRFCDRTSSIAGCGLDLLELPDREPPAGLIDRLRGFDSIVSWYGSGRAEFREAAERLGLPIQFLDALPRTGSCHAVDFYLGQVAALGTGPVAIAEPRIACPAVERSFAVLHPFSGSASKNWPMERFRDIAARLRHLLPVYWCAGPEEVLDCAVRKDDLYELACWLAGARVYVGNDSGITHLAAAVGTPVVALFGPTDASVWGPRGPRVRVVKGGPRMTDLPVEAVWRSVCEVLA
jgi:heptosyltransferase-3